jgi:hypothetical protein
MKNTASAFITVTTYDEFFRFVDAFAKGRIPLLLVVGDPGVSKSQSVKRALTNPACWIEGQASAVSMYCLLYHNRNLPVIIDDVDCLYANDSARRLIKCLCQTDPVKRLSWNTMNKSLDEGGIPRQFDTTSNVCIIANEWKTLSQDVAAIEDRAVAINFRPTALEVHLQVAEWFDDQEVFDFMGSIIHLIESPSMRHYLIAKHLRRARFKNWQKLTVERVSSAEVQAIAKIKSDPKLTTEKDRVARWIREGHGSRPTYFRAAQKLPAKVKVPKLKVKGPPKPPTPTQPDDKTKVSKSHDSRKDGPTLRIVGGA